MASCSLTLDLSLNDLGDPRPCTHTTLMSVPSFVYLIHQYLHFRFRYLLTSFFSHLDRNRTENHISILFFLDPIRNLRYHLELLTNSRIQTFESSLLGTISGNNDLSMLAAISRDFLPYAA